jgi:hypothetical protein
MNDEIIQLLLHRLNSIDERLAAMAEEKQPKSHYSTQEVAEKLGKAEFTVREWCRLGRVLAIKRKSGRGAHAAWVVSHVELLRYQREGLLPVSRVAPATGVGATDGSRRSPSSSR